MAFSDTQITSAADDVHSCVHCEVMFVPSSVLHWSTVSVVCDAAAAAHSMRGPNFSTQPRSRRFNRTNTSTGYGALHVNTLRFCESQTIDTVGGHFTQTTPSDTRNYSLTHSLTHSTQQTDGPRHGHSVIFTMAGLCQSFQRFDCKS